MDAVELRVVARVEDQDVVQRGLDAPRLCGSAAGGDGRVGVRGVGGGRVGGGGTVREGDQPDRVSEQDQLAGGWELWVGGVGEFCPAGLSHDDVVRGCGGERAEEVMEG